MNPHDVLSLNDALARLHSITTKDSPEENESTESTLDFVVALDDDNHPLLLHCFPGCTALPSQVAMSSACIGIKLTANVFLSDLRVTVKSIEQSDNLGTLFPMKLKGGIKWNIDKDGAHVVKFSVAGKVPSKIVSALMSCIDETLSLSVNEMQLNLFASGDNPDDEKQSA